MLAFRVPTHHAFAIRQLPLCVQAVLLTPTLIHPTITLLASNALSASLEPGYFSSAAQLQTLTVCNVPTQSLFPAFLEQPRVLSAVCVLLASTGQEYAI